MGEIKRQFSERYHHYIWIKTAMEYIKIPCFDATTYSNILQSEFSDLSQKRKYKIVKTKVDPLIYLYTVNYELRDIPNDIRKEISMILSGTS